MPAIADQEESETIRSYDRPMTVANQLGMMLASEEPCGLSYDPAAIEFYIAVNVAEDDMAFPSYLSVQTSGQESIVEDMTPSALRAHCTQIERAARSYDFID